MKEDIIANLSFIRELKVVPRPTAMRYRDSKQPIRQIAQELGVAYVHLGTVRKSGDKVRITGTLMNGRSEEQLWMKPFEKNLTDQFAIQAALATEIAGALSAVISPEAQKLIRRVPTENTVAYDKYLQARESINAGEAAAEKQVTLLQDAVALDRQFAVAWAWLAKVHGLEYLGNRDHSPERLAKAKAAINTAVRLAPDDPEVIWNLGYFYYHEGRDYTRVMEQLEWGERLQPGAAIWSFGFAAMERRMGKWIEALAHQRQAAQLDPGNYDYALQVRDVALAGRRFDEALVAQRRVAELRDTAALNAFTIARLHFLQNGSTRQLETFFSGEPPDGERSRRKTWAATVGNYAEAIRLDALAPATGLAATFEIALCLAANGDMAAARDRIAKLTPPLRERLKFEPENATVWGQLGCSEAVLGSAEEARRCALKSVQFLPESVDTWMGPDRTNDLAFVYAWIGDKNRAIAEYARVLQTVGRRNGNVSFGAVPNVHVMKRHPAFFPLQGDPRFEALLNDPKNNAPLF